jgi:hypothetical protein
MIESESDKKWDQNREFFSKNYKSLQKIYGGNNIVIINEKVAFAAASYKEWCEKWYNLTPSLTTDERIGAYHTYLPREGEFIVIGPIIASK